VVCGVCEWESVWYVCVAFIVNIHDFYVPGSQRCQLRRTRTSLHSNVSLPPSIPPSLLPPPSSLLPPPSHPQKVSAESAGSESTNDCPVNVFTHTHTHTERERETDVPTILSVMRDGHRYARHIYTPLHTFTYTTHISHTSPVGGTADSHLGEAVPRPPRTLSSACSPPLAVCGCVCVCIRSCFVHLRVCDVWGGEPELSITTTNHQ